MKKKIYCNDVGREISKRDCWPSKSSLNCRTCTDRPPKISSFKKPIEKSTKPSFRQNGKDDLDEHIYTQYPPDGRMKREDVDKLPGHVAELDLPSSETILLLRMRERSFKETQNSVYALETFLIADKAGLFPPDWALSWLLKGFWRYHKLLGKKPLEQTLGLVKKAGQAPPFKGVLLKQGDEKLMFDIFLLHKFGKYSVRLASKMVAKRLEDTKDYDQTGWGLIKKNADSLEKEYHQKWKSIFETISEETLNIVQGGFQKYQEEFMNQFVDPKSLSERRSI